MMIRIERHKPLAKRTNSFFRWSKYFFFVVGILALSYCGFALLDAKLYQAYQTWRFQQALKDVRQSTGNSGRLPTPPLPPPTREATSTRAESLNVPLREGSPLGRIEISTLGLEAMILEGTDQGTLRRGVGHIRGTPLPGQQGNVALAGHRDTFFRALRSIRKDDEITLTTLLGSCRYRVDFTKVVQPEDTEVLDSSDEAILTLVTCYPFNFVSSAPNRFVVRARRIPG